MEDQHAPAQGQWVVFTDQALDLPHGTPLTLALPLHYRTQVITQGTPNDRTRNGDFILGMPGDDNSDTHPLSLTKGKLQQGQPELLQVVAAAGISTVGYKDLSSTGSGE